MVKISLQQLSDDYLRAFKEELRQRVEKAAKEEAEKAIAELIPKLVNVVRFDVFRRAQDPQEIQFVISIDGELKE